MSLSCTLDDADTPLMSMQIERLEVEEGFLDGLVMGFSPGLNVIIGPRGTGKTSIVELIRFCLDVRAFTADAQESAMKHVADVLGAGRVVVSGRSNGASMSISRSLNDPTPRVSGSTSLAGVTILSQREIEQVGRDGAGKLRLVDDFAPVSDASRRYEQQAIERIRSLTTELHRLTTDLAALNETVHDLEAARAELIEAQSQAGELLESLKELSVEQQELEHLGEISARLAARGAILERAATDLQAWHQRLQSTLIGIPSLPTWPDGDDPDLLVPLRVQMEMVRELLTEATTHTATAMSEVEAQEASNRERQAVIGDRSRELRRLLDAAVKGAGSASARVASLQEQLGVLGPTKTRQESIQARISEVQEARQEALDELDKARAFKYEKRAETAASLNELLGPRIDVQVIRYGRQEAYAAAIAEALRGTRIHYKQLAPQLAATLSPRELVEAAETDDVPTIAEITQLDSDRVGRILEAIRADGGAAILGAQLDDSVRLRLLDGDEYKETEKVSTGQRCTVVLPLLLEQRQRTLLIDQPEDHLDNGFIVETVVRAIHGRPVEDQLIVATHNANIPVLGNASRVFVMGSDGSTGYLDKYGALDDPPIVGSITRIMEGGWEAFERRRDFYREHGI